MTKSPDKSPLKIDFGVLRRIRYSETYTFEELAKIAGLDPNSDFLGADLSGVDWRDSDKSQFVLTASPEARDGEVASQTEMKPPQRHDRSSGMGGAIGIVILAHGGLAREYLAAIEHVVGPQSGIRAVSIGPDDEREAKQAEIVSAADEVDTGLGVVIVTDMFGGSTSNLSLRAVTPSNRKILYGANLPMLIKLAKSRRLGIQGAVDAAMAAGRKYHNISQKVRFE